MSPDEQDSRKVFERWMTQAHHKSVRRFSEHAVRSPWPGKYCDLQVQLAWEAWQESRRVVTSLIPEIVEEIVMKSLKEQGERLVGILKTENGAEIADSPNARFWKEMVEL